MSPHRSLMGHCQPTSIDSLGSVEAALQAVGRADHAVIAGTVAPADGGADRAADLGVVLDGGVHAPLRRPVDRSRRAAGRDSRSLTGGPPGSVTSWSLEAQPLRDAEARRFGAGVGVDQPGADAQREQVVVGNAVVAAERVLGVDGREVEIVARRIVVGQLALVAERRVDVEGPRLQRLAKAPAEVAGVALEHQAAVQAEGGHRAAGRRCAVGSAASNWYCVACSCTLGMTNQPGVCQGRLSCASAKARWPLGWPVSSGSASKRCSRFRCSFPARRPDCCGHGARRSAAGGRRAARSAQLTSCRVCHFSARAVTEKLPRAPGQRAVVGQQALRERRTAREKSRQ